MDESTLLMQETIASRLACAVLIVCLTWLISYLIHNWRKTKIAEKRAEVLKARARVETLETAFRHLEGDQFADLQMELAEQDEIIRNLTRENKKLQTRLNGILKANPDVKKHGNREDWNGIENTLYL